MNVFVSCEEQAKSLKNLKIRLFHYSQFDFHESLEAQKTAQKTYANWNSSSNATCVNSKSNLYPRFTPSPLQKTTCHNQKLLHWRYPTCTHSVATSLCQPTRYFHPKPILQTTYTSNHHESTTRPWNHVVGLTNDGPVHGPNFPRLGFRPFPNPPPPLRGSK